MSRRKVRGLTRTGRQVSEDPDLDNLLSNLSPEDLEELEKEVVTAPDLDRNEGKLLDQGDTQSQPATNHNRDVKLLDTQERDTKKLNQRERSFEGEPKKETRKQEYLRKMGLSQEGKEEGIQRQASVSSDQENKMEDRNNKGPGSSKEDRAGASYRYRRAENKDNEVKEEMKEKERNEDSKLKEKRENRESTSSKTRDMILKLQEKKDDSREKERKEDSRKSVDSKTKELISKLKEKDEKEKDRKEDMKKREDNKTRGLVSKMVEKQSQVQECKTGDKKTKAEKSGLQVERQMSHEKESEGEKKVEKEEVKEKAKEKEAEIKQKENGEENKKTVNEEGIEKKREKEENKGKDTNEGLESSKSEKLGNCVEKKGTPIKKTKEEEEEDEDSSMFDELMEQVRSNDPSMLELNINNSEVIKTKTLIQFAEALHNNSHIKTLALANCRADDHVAYAIAGTLRSNKTITSINLDSNHLTPKGIIALIHALQHNATLTELRFHNQRHICGGKTEMEMTKVLKDNTTLLKLGYHFELAGPRMTMTNILSRNMDRQRQKRLQEQKLAQANGGDKKGALEVPKTGKGFLRGSPKASPKPSPHPSPMPSPKLTPKRASGGVPGGGPPPPPPPPGAPPPPPPLAPMLDIDTLRNTLTPVSQRKMGDKEGSQSGGKNSRDQLLASIRAGNKIQLKKVAVPKLLQ